MPRSTRFPRAVAMGVLALVAATTSIPAVAAPAADPSSPASLPTVAPHAGTTQTQYRRWVVKLASDSSSARRVRGQKRTANAMDALDSTDASRIRSTAQKHGATVSTAIANAGDHVTVQLDRPIDATAARSMVGGQVTSVEPDITMTAADMGSMTSTPNDTYASLQWAITGAYGSHANQVWPTDTGKGVTVAVLDTGITNHPELTGRTVAGYDFVSDASAARDGNGREADPHDMGDWSSAGVCGSNSAAENSSWHGTHVASLIGATGNNSAGISGVAPGASVEPVRVLAECGGSSADIADAITWASGGHVTGVPDNPNPAKVLNLSLGGSYDSCPNYYQSAIDGARSRGSIVVVAAGNSGVDASRSTPANCTGVVVVAATGQSGARASYSNYGSRVTLAAPGGGGTTSTDYIVGASNSGTTSPGTPGYVYMAGTSQATPQVAGTIALMAAWGPSLTADQAISVLKSTATRSSDSSIGAGLVNAPSAVSAAKALGPNASSTTVSVTYPATGRFGEHTGDAYADVYAVGSNGDLSLFAGGPSSASRAQSYGTTMAGVTYLVQIGDWTGDGRSDVLARTADNALWIYASRADGSLAAWKKVGQNWGAMDQIVYAGSLDGKAKYVVGRQGSTGNLYRYTFTSAGLSATTQVGHGWNGMTAFFSVGDFNQDGRGDVIGVRRDGTMWFYAGTTSATLAAGVQVGHGWSSFSHAFSAGDLDGDGRMDLLGIDPQGRLWAYHNGGNGTWGAAHQLGSGFDGYSLVA